MKRATAALPEWDAIRVGRRIAALRSALGFTQRTLAAMIGESVTPQKINNYERGRNLIPPHIAGRLCAVTGANFDYIYQGRLNGLPQDVREALAKLDKPARPDKPATTAPRRA